MSEFRAKLKNVIGGDKRRSIISACVMIAVSLAMFLIALTAPFQYYSDRDVLHIVYIESGDAEDGGEAEVVVSETRRIHQSLFQAFEAITMLGDASTLHAASLGEIFDQKEYDSARERLTELRAEYSDIVNRTMREAQSKGIAEDSEEYVNLLADNLSDMNLMALDMLETAFASDNSGAFEAVYGGVVLGLISGIINILIMVAALTAAVFAVYWLVTKSNNTKYSIFLKIFTALAATGILMCVFNPVVPPAACPLALACVAVSAFFAAGLVRAMIGDAPVSNIIRNSVAAAVVSVAVLCLAAIPSLTIYVNGMGGQHLFYPGTVGTVYYSRVEAMIKIGLDIPDGAVTVAFVLGITVCALSVIAVTIALDRLYGGSKNNGGIFAALLVAIAATALALVISVAAMTSSMQAEGTRVKYIVGACWYVNLVFMLAAAVFSWVFGAVIKRKSSEQAIEPADEVEDEDDNTENISADVGEQA